MFSDGALNSSLKLMLMGWDCWWRDGFNNGSDLWLSLRLLAVDKWGKASVGEIISTDLVDEIGGGTVWDIVLYLRLEEV